MKNGPVMIMVAPNGARRTKADHPALPVTADEVAAEALKCRDAGASAIHVHVRGDDGAHVLDAARYIETGKLIAEATGGEMVVQITTEAVGLYKPHEQIALVRDVVPVSVSMAVRELVPDDAAHEPMRSLCQWMQANRVAPQFILYDAADVERFFALQASGVIPYENPFLLFVLGRYATDQQSDPGDLQPFLDVLGDRNVPWAMCAFGARETECAEAAVAAGGHVRVGFENNFHMPDGTVAPDNAALVAVTAQRIRSLGLDVMTPGQAMDFVGSTLQ